MMDEHSMARKPTPRGEEDKAFSDIEAVKRLLILDLVLKGLKQRQIALALGVSEATLSMMFPKGLLREIREGRTDAAS